MHENAAGFSLPYKHLSKFHSWANEALADVDLLNSLWEVDFSFSATGESRELKQVINDMDSMKTLWGHGFSEPLIHIRDIGVNIADVNAIGKGDTVKVMHNGIAYMFFKRTLEEVQALTELQFMELEIVGRANLNSWRGNYTPQIFVVDYTVKSNALSF